MSDLSATSCGCGCDNGCNNGCGSNFLNFGGNNSCIWIILLLVFCGGCGNGGSLFGGNGGCGCGNDNGGNCCSLIIWLLILSSICGGNNGGCGCGNSCC